METYSDGALKGEGSQQLATYGWVIPIRDRCEEGGDPARWKCVAGGGVVHGDPRLLCSLRAELNGVLAVVMYLVKIGWSTDVVHRLDNMGVTQDGVHGERMAMGERGDADMWLKTKHIDMWMMLEQWRRRLKGEFRLEWVRGHPEKRVS